MKNKVRIQASLRLRKSAQKCLGLIPWRRLKKREKLKTSGKPNALTTIVMLSSVWKKSRTLFAKGVDVLLEAVPGVATKSVGKMPRRAWQVLVTIFGLRLRFYNLGDYPALLWRFGACR